MTGLSPQDRERLQRAADELEATLDRVTQVGREETRKQRRRKLGAMIIFALFVALLALAL
ncbi:hypothetical protein A3A39_02955 [Candidatus Kaiserbacteria bacterium RIFCSPLOWO2_01_FULL_54_13]|uniref:Uncharacterized protein n=1 Tax=Candidatus Kaiserbacteria bacterium RIFCSPLOWO2_01_FULL_54_13 TaxID=1798512 RepID=A0A1F6F2W7_9BACT|nr:MAG: hypothetical protein A3A39_02955 [Candidatus Kaiserbacteria bacterium RIFCSPLOWO2_01_FULL_54_13]